MRITERYELALKNILQRLTVGEDAVDHALYVETIVTEASGLSIMKPILTAVLTMPALIQGDRLGHLSRFDTVHPSLEEFDNRIQTMLTELRQARLNMVRELEHQSMERSHELSA